MVAEPPAQGLLLGSLAVLVEVQAIQQEPALVRAQEHLGKVLLAERLPGRKQRQIIRLLVVEVLVLLAET